MTLAQEQLYNYAYEYVEDFHTFIESIGSENTADGYVRHLNHFAQTVFKCTLDFLTVEQIASIDSNTIIKYQTEITKSKKFANSTINNKMSAIRKFMKYVKARKLTTYDIGDDVEFIRNVKSNSQHYDTIPMEVVPQIIEYIQTKEKHLKVEKEWFIKIAVETGLRASNILKLTKSHFTPHMDGTHVIIKSDLDNMGKGNSDWSDVIHIEFYKEIEENLFTDSENLFTMDESTIRKRLQAIMKKLGYNGNYVPHSLKRTAINNTKEFTNDVKAMQAKGKHSNASTTLNHYTDDTMKYGATGYYSMQYKVKGDLISTATHEELLQAIDGLDESVILLLQLQLQKIKGGK
jgi:site-specific recombinase XerD